MAEGWKPHPGPQWAFHRSKAFELFYGGAAGGGKSESLLEEATRYISKPGYAGVLFRRSYPELTQQGGLVPRSQEKYPRLGAVYNATHRRWDFPFGSTISFAHLHHDDDRYQYQGAAWHYIAFDELTHFPEEVYLYLFSRARTTIADIPVRIRAASNPGNLGHEWVKKRFVDKFVRDIIPPERDDTGKIVKAGYYPIKYFRSVGGTEVETDADDPAGLSRQYIPATIFDNPALLSVDGSYLSRLEALPLLERERLLRGDWDIMPAGNIFKREWFQRRVRSAPDGLQWVRYWDLAASVKESANFTASAAVAEDNGDIYIKDVIRGRWEWPDAKRLLKETILGEASTAQGIESAQHGLAAFQELMRDSELLGMEIRSVVVDKDKLSRALPWSARAEAGKVVLVEGPWTDSFVNEVVAFSGDGKTHDDQVDAVSGAVQMVVDKRDRVLRIQNNPFR